MGFFFYSLRVKERGSYKVLIMLIELAFIKASGITEGDIENWTVGFGNESRQEIISTWVINKLIAKKYASYRIEDDDMWF